MTQRKTVGLTQRKTATENDRKTTATELMLEKESEPRRLPGHVVAEDSWRSSAQEAYLNEGMLNFERRMRRSCTEHQTTGAPDLRVGVHDAHAFKKPTR